MLTIPVVASWILNAIVFAIFLCLYYYYAAADTFIDYNLFPMGTVVFFGLVHALQFKAAFLQHQWNYVTISAMAVSVIGLFLYVLTYSAVEPPAGWMYYGIGTWSLSLGFFWLFSCFSIPVFLIIVDLISHSFLLYVEPSNELLYRELDLKFHQTLLRNSSLPSSISTIEGATEMAIRNTSTGNRSITAVNNPMNFSRKPAHSSINL